MGWVEKMREPWEGRDKEGNGRERDNVGFC